MIKVFFDVETDGIGYFSPPTQRLLQLAYVIISEGKVVFEKSVFSREIEKLSETHPNKKLLEFAKKSTSTTAEIITEFVSYIITNFKTEKILFISHNVHFDMGVVMYEINKNDIKFNIPNNWHFLCTMRKSTSFCQLPKTGKAARFPGFKFPKLLELAEKFKIPFEKEMLHNARYDIEILMKCYSQGKAEALW